MPYLLRVCMQRVYLSHMQPQPCTPALYTCTGVMCLGKGVFTAGDRVEEVRDMVRAWFNAPMADYQVGTVVKPMRMVARWRATQRVVACACASPRAHV